MQLLDKSDCLKLLKVSIGAIIQLLTWCTCSQNRIRTGMNVVFMALAGTHGIYCLQ